MSHIRTKNIGGVNQARRIFMQRASALSVAGVATPWALNLAAMGDASAAGATDYKAIVCVFLYGGNDYANTLVPYDAASYAAYQALRPSLAYTRDALTPTLLTSATAPIDSGGVSRQFALAPSMASLVPLFNGGQMAALLNVGTLMQPTSKAQYRAKSVPLPPKLFSHNDQSSIWQSSAPEGAQTGWGGRMGDLFASSNGNSTFTCINVAGNAVFLTGQNAVQYQVSTSGPMSVAALKSNLFGSKACSDTLRALITQNSGNMLEAEHARVVRRALDSNDSMSAALAGSPALATTFPAGNSLADQLKLVARMISVGASMGTRRQVFFVSIGGFDMHDGLVSKHGPLLAKVADAMAAFYASTKEMGMADKVTAFTASDFGRTLTANNDGSDHGWGSMQFVLGGAVKGASFYGTAPILANDGPDDVGQGRLVPTTSVDQLAATLGGWLGVSDTDLTLVLPKLANFNASSRKLGFA